MSTKDKQKWDLKYKNNKELLEPREASKMVKLAIDYCSGKRALDLACGAGRNTIYLEQQGFNVDAVDISIVALEVLRSRVGKNVSLIEADLDTFEIKKDKYDLIAITNFLDRELIQKAKNALKDGGVIVVETYMQDKDNEKKDSNPDFLLQKDELPSMFQSSFEILKYKEFWNESYEKYRMKKASIIVKKL